MQKRLRALEQKKNKTKQMYKTIDETTTWKIDQTIAEKKTECK